MLAQNATNSTVIHSLLLELISGTKGLQGKGIPSWIMRLKELLHEHWNEQMTLQEMSVIVGVHPITISKFFRKFFACTLGEYQRKLKIEKSIQLIKNSDMTLSEIAFYCGFADQSHFIRNFKKMTGFLPKHFQNF